MKIHTSRPAARSARLRTYPYLSVTIRISSRPLSSRPITPPSASVRPVRQVRQVRQFA